VLSVVGRQVEGRAVCPGIPLGMLALDVMVMVHNLSISLAARETAPTNRRLSSFNLVEALRFPLGQAEVLAVCFLPRGLDQLLVLLDGD